MDPDDRHSSVRLQISVAVEYNRKRAALGDRWEARFSTVGLLLVGALVVLLVLLLIGRWLGALG